ncbi:hypothetical protein F3K52_13505 [Pseudomonas lactis]|nr:hypothetical protein F3K52_13505 [Pseudomonas lactis]
MARELAPAGVRSAPKNSGAASQPDGSKLPRHKKQLLQETLIPPGKSPPRKRLKIPLPVRPF